MKKWICLLITLWGSLLSQFALASLLIPMYLTSGNGHPKKIGVVIADDTIYGLLLTPKLYGLTPGVHGIHVHVLPFCSNHGKAAGGHLDPVRTDNHAGPYRGDSHLGDLPVLIVDASGKATLPILAPRLKLADIKGHSLMIHSKGDDYTNNAVKDNPRFACGVIPMIYVSRP